MKAVAERPGQKLVVADDAKPGDVRLKGRIMQGDGTLGPEMDFQTLLAQGYWREVMPYAVKDFDESKHPRDAQGKFAEIFEQAGPAETPKGDTTVGSKVPTFTGKPGKVEYSGYVPRAAVNGKNQDLSGKDAVQWYAEKLLGEKLDDADFARLAGAPDGALVQVGADEEDIVINTSIPEINLTQMRSVHESDDGLEIRNAYFNVDQNDATKGLGIRALAEEVTAAREFGIERITTHAAGYGPPRGNEMNGYYTWPRMGFDGELRQDGDSIYATKVKEAQDAGLLPSDKVFESSSSTSHTAPNPAKTLKVSDAMQTQESRDWWKYNGWGLELTLDLNGEGGKRFDAYAKSKGAM